MVSNTLPTLEPIIRLCGESSGIYVLALCTDTNQYLGVEVSLPSSIVPLPDFDVLRWFRLETIHVRASLDYAAKTFATMNGGNIVSIRGDVATIEFRLPDGKTVYVYVSRKG